MVVALLLRAVGEVVQVVTKAGVAVIDPTSKERSLQPSKHMTVHSRPDWKVGLGMGADPDVIDHLASKYPEETRAAADKAAAKLAAKLAAADGPKTMAAKNRLPEPGAASVRMMALEAAARPLTLAIVEIAVKSAGGALRTTTEAPGSSGKNVRISPVSP